MRHFLVAYVTAAVVFLALDAIWLSLMSSRLYRPALAHLMRPDVDFLAAGLFYLLYIAGLVIIVVLPAPSAPRALMYGALFGLVCYATYDLTNQATLRDWPWVVTLADLAWGSVVTAAASIASYAVLARFLR